MYQFPPDARKALEAMPLPIAYYQKDGDRIVAILVSDGLCKMMGAERDKLINHLNSGLLDRVHPDDAGRIARIIREFSNHLCGYDVIYRGKYSQNDDYHYIHSIGHFQTAPDGTELAIFAYTDMSDSQSEDKWYAFRDKCYARVARRWCEDNDLEYYQKGKGIPLEELLEDIAEDEDEPVDVVKIDMESLSIPGTAEALLKNLFGAEVEHVADEEITEEEAANSLSPAQAIKLMFLHKQMTRLKEGLASLAKDVPASLGEVLTSCSEDVSAALNRLEQEIGEVEILAEDEQVEKLEEIVELLKKHAKGTDQATD